ncbi:MAG: ABC transporter ATP-binding protein [Spirochaetaceae bacterium]|nr:ABC transporter ATP-binding protein [Myxococcales bacterium]MCB9723603.1 ABC transporter ATP-binding protein [Spirochaetaceae bacterium]
MGKRHDAPRVLATGRCFLVRFGREIREQRGLLAASFAALLGQTLLRLLEPWPLGLVVDHVLGVGEDGATVGLLAGIEPTRLLVGAAVAVVAIAILRAGAGYVGTVGFAIVGNRVLTTVRERLFRHLQSLSLAYHARSRSGDVVVRVIGDVGTVRDVTVTALLPLFANALVLVGMLGVMAWLDWRLTALALSTVPLFWLSMVRLGRRIQTVSRKQRRQEGLLAGTAAESLVGIETVQSLSLDSTFADRFGSQNDGSMRAGVKAKRLSARLERTVDVVAALATGLVLFFGAKAALAGALRVGELVVFMSYLKTAIRPVRGMAKYTARLAKASAAAERVLEIIEELPEVADREDAVEAPALRGEIRFEGADFGYARGEPVLRGVDLVLPAGAHVAIVGPSGAGKSTLVASVLRLIDPLAGCVRIDGHDLREYTLRSLRRQVAVVPQETLLFTGTIAENIALARPDATREEIEACARLARAHAFVSALPHGYDEPVGERGADLSVGQRRRLAIARAALSAAPIVILDEPLASLDRENQIEVERALEASTKGRTTLHVTHDLEAACRADRVLVIEDGRVVEYGPPAALVAGDGHLARRMTHFAGGLDAGVG